MLARAFGAGRNDLETLYGDGSGNLAESPPLPAGNYAPLVTDVNGDGRQDIVALNLDVASIVVMLNRGGRVFEASSELASLLAPGSLVAADLNADGRPDLIENAPRKGVGVLMNRGDGSYFAPVLYDRRDVSPVVADFTGDGVPDIAV